MVVLGTMFASIAPSACPEESALWILDGSTPDSLVFGLGREPGKEESVDFGALLVEKCDSTCSGKKTRMWAIEDPPSDSVRAFASRVTYGVVPSGFVEDRPAEHLTVGCYLAAIMGTGSVRFCIESNRVIPEDSD